ncbi:MAG: MMPL family transporter [Rhizomicrobium sp.]
MRKLLALCWLVLVLAALAHLGWRALEGITFRADLMALVPREQSDPAAARASNTAINFLSRRVVLLVGHLDRTQARRAATALTATLEKSGQFHAATGGLDSAKLKAIGTAYYPYRAGLLSRNDRSLLQANKGQVLTEQALAQVYGVGGMASAALLKNDPFLLLPHFLTSLPVPQSQLTLDNGLLSVHDGGQNWVLISGVMAGEPYGLDTQKRFTGLVDTAVAQQRQAQPGLSVLRAGAVFYAKAGAATAMNETSAIGLLSVALTILLLIAAFRSVTPLILSLAVIAVGLLTAFSFSLWFWGQIHVLALLFGVSLIGVTVDYSLQYFSEIYAPDAGDAFTRMENVLPGITLGAITTAAGYLLLLLAPFPGLRQIAVFSVVGLVAAWLTVALWLPFLDRSQASRHAMPLQRPLAAIRNFWHSPSRRLQRMAALFVLVLACLIGLWRFHADDDVHNMQNLSPPLVAEQKALQQHIGIRDESRFFVVYNNREEDMLQKEEALGRRLDSLIAYGQLGSYQSVAGYVPSLKTQTENRHLIRDRLYKPYLSGTLATLGLSAAPLMPAETAPGLTVDKLAGSMDFLTVLRPQADTGGRVHIVTLQGVKAPAALANAARGIAGVKLIDPGNDYSALFAKYRVRALALLALSILVMALILMPRYGLKRSLHVLLAPLIAVAATPFLCALFGASFTFFDVIALVLVLSMAMDYAVFFAESNERRGPATHFAVTLSACTTIISFGFLAFSSVHAVHNFGLTMLVGVTLALLLTPMGKKPAV